jgi:hypothetical protein
MAVNYPVESREYLSRKRERWISPSNGASPLTIPSAIVCLQPAAVAIRIGTKVGGYFLRLTSG